MTSVIQSETERAFRRLGVTGEASAVLMIVFGVLVIAFPALIAWIVGVYLIVVGAMQLAAHMGAKAPPAGPGPGP